MPFPLQVEKWNEVGCFAGPKQLVTALWAGCLLASLYAVLISLSAAGAGQWHLVWKVRLYVVLQLYAR